MKWRLLLPGASEPRLTAARPPGLQSRCQRPLTRPPQPEHSCHSQLLHWPDDGGTIPSKETPFTPSSILFSPPPKPGRGRVSVEAPGTAPGSDGFIPTLVYRHSRPEGRHPRI